MVWTPCLVPWGAVRQKNNNKCYPPSCGHHGDKSAFRGRAQCVQQWAQRERCSLRGDSYSGLIEGPCWGVESGLNVCAETNVCALMEGSGCNWWGWSGKDVSTMMTCSVRVGGGGGGLELSGDRWLAHLLHSLRGPLVATTTPERRRKCGAVSKRGRPARWGENVNDGEALKSFTDSTLTGTEGADVENLQNAACKCVHQDFGTFLFFAVKKNTSFVKQLRSRAENFGLTYCR